MTYGGWPTRLLRAALGPVLQNPRAVEHVEYEVDAAHLELWKHLSIGCGLSSARVSCLAKWDTGSSAFIIAHQSEAWNPRAALAHPALARTGTGVYTYTFPSATVVDLNGQSIALDLEYGRCSICSTSPVGTTQPLSGDVINMVTSPASFTINLFNGAGSPIDKPFWLEIF